MQLSTKHNTAETSNQILSHDNSSGLLSSTLSLFSGERAGSLSFAATLSEATTSVVQVPTVSTVGLTSTLLDDTPTPSLEGEGKGEGRGGEERGGDGRGWEGREGRWNNEEGQEAEEGESQMHTAYRHYYIKSKWSYLAGGLLRQVHQFYNIHDLQYLLHQSINTYTSSTHTHAHTPHAHTHTHTHTPH